MIRWEGSGSDNPLDLGDLMDAGGADVEVLEDTVADPVDPAMDSQFLAFGPGVLDNGGMADIGHLFNDIELAQ